MPDAFQNYANEYGALKHALTVKLDDEVPQLRGEERKAALRRVSNELEEADEILDQMELEAKGKAKLMVQVRAYKQEVKSWRSKITTLSSQTDRDLLLSSAPSHSAYGLNVTEDDADADELSSRQRQRLLQSTNTLSGSSNRLDNAHRLAAENEEIGQGVLNSLVGQRMQLTHANEQLEEADVSVGRAGKTIGKMVRLAYRQKIVIWLFVVVLLALIALILYFKFR
ncbi:hypothetical protein JCM6882_002295 [Rhodosporidiobolus microsporus]